MQMIISITTLVLLGTQAGIHDCARGDIPVESLAYVEVVRRPITLSHRRAADKARDPKFPRCHVPLALNVTLITS